MPGSKAIKERIEELITETTGLILVEPSVKIPKYQYVGFDFPILDEMW
jgi:hypothetical protein